MIGELSENYFLWSGFRIDVTELQITGIGIFMISGLFGVQIWSLQVRHVSIICCQFGSFRP